MIDHLPASLLLMASLGFMGSLHCIGMCGGLISAISMSRPHIHWKGLFVYQIGRITTYALLGALVGLSGFALQSFAIDGLQRLLAVIAGSLMILFAFNLAGWLPDPLRRLSAWASRKTGLARLAHSAAAKARTGSWFTLGLANGLLPCGLVYAALAFVLAANNSSKSTLILSHMNDLGSASLMMASFGFGTIPAMMLAPAALQRFTPSMRSSAMRIAALLIFILGSITIWRSTMGMHA